ncbi:MAG: PQQ-binding-like beta-propeller repeat protein, partial [Lentisphaeria bacterium]
VFWIADDEGVLHVYSYKNDEFKYLTHYKILPGVDAWGPIAYAGGLMILRDDKSMICLDLRTN